MNQRTDMLMYTLICILGAVQIKYPQATEHEISEPIKSWFRHASERAQKMNA